MQSRLIILLLIHLVLVCVVPLCKNRVMQLAIQPGILPIFWALKSVLVGQLMLLAAYLGMVRGDFVKRVLVTGGAVVGAVLAATELSDVYKRGDEWIQMLPVVGMLLEYVVAVAILMWIASRWMGHIDLVSTSKKVIGQNCKSQFSIMGAMVLMSAVGLVLGILRLVAERVASGQMSEQVGFLLFVTLHGTNMLMTVWATLNQGRATWRVVVVFFISAILGLCNAKSAGLWGPWGVQIRQAIPMTVFTLVPTAIVVASLLWLRGAGYRLVHSSLPK